MAHTVMGAALDRGIEASVAHVTARAGGSGVACGDAGDTAARELRVRVAAALARLGVDGGVALQLRPRPAHDLAALVAALVALDVAPPSRDVFVGEIALDGRLRPVRGVLAAIEAAAGAGAPGIVVPRACAAEAALVDVPIPVRVAGTVEEVLAYLRGASLDAPTRRHAAPSDPDPLVMPASVACAASDIAAAARAGGVLLVGAPGSGKTLVGRAAAAALPPLRDDERLEVARVWSAAGLLGEDADLRRPFRAPHHTVSEAGMLGGGLPARPGEVSLAHGGILFLDEATEFRRAVLDGALGAWSEGSVRVARAGDVVTLPARCGLIAAVNPCPCGYRNHPRRECRCTGAALARWDAEVAKLSAALATRVDLPPFALAGGT